LPDISCAPTGWSICRPVTPGGGVRAGSRLVGFDPANGICTTDAHARVAIGLDYLGAAPVRGTRYGGGMETLTVAVKVDQADGRASGRASRETSVIPGCAVRRRPGIHTPGRGYGFRARASRAPE